MSAEQSEEEDLSLHDLIMKALPEFQRGEGDGAKLDVYRLATALDVSAEALYKRFRTGHPQENTISVRLARRIERLSAESAKVNNHAPVLASAFQRFFV
ncbi:hypothetical protein HDIA_0711 [Hartmannibacter diazotrophicus]|uniref:Uncharacterized protein n=1 Tax=Hartmannibacter diazotrophicus TaxID=1482074 RepID=A0A2C9D1Q3_9HYPH|nr:hypothetical protein [Hartmannibacter diazotrophicus]SON54252.1 hypothetical protein HDIA_0711 [Hartmannibacter diazotrophicus]